MMGKLLGSCKLNGSFHNIACLIVYLLVLHFNVRGEKSSERCMNKNIGRNIIALKGNENERKKQKTHNTSGRTGVKHQFNVLGQR